MRSQDVTLDAIVGSTRWPLHETVPLMLLK
jgi:hypothetical protein